MSVTFNVEIPKQILILFLLMALRYKRHLHSMQDYEAFAQ